MPQILFCLRCIIYRFCAVYILRDFLNFSFDFIIPIVHRVERRIAPGDGLQYGLRQLNSALAAARPAVIDREAVAQIAANTTNYVYFLVGVGAESVKRYDR